MTYPCSPIYITQAENLNTFNNILKKVIREAKKIFNENLFAKFKNDMRGTWKTINDILCKTKKKKSFQSYFKIKIITLSQIKHRLQTKVILFFTNVGPTLQIKYDHQQISKSTYQKHIRIFLNFKILNNRI